MLQRTCSVTNMAWPMCKRPVTFAGGIAIVYGCPSGLYSGLKNPLRSHHAYVSASLEGSNALPSCGRCGSGVAAWGCAVALSAAPAQDSLWDVCKECVLLGGIQQQTGQVALRVVAGPACQLYNVWPHPMLDYCFTPSVLYSMCYGICNAGSMTIQHTGPLAPSCTIVDEACAAGGM